jgi:hypothetical protein
MQLLLSGILVLLDEVGQVRVADKFIVSFG